MALGCSVQMDMTMLTVSHMAKFIVTVVHGNWRYDDDFRGTGRITLLNIPRVALH